MDLFNDDHIVRPSESSWRKRRLIEKGWKAKLWVPYFEWLWVVTSGLFRSLKVSVNIPICCLDVQMCFLDRSQFWSGQKKSPNQHMCKVLKFKAMKTVQSPFYSLRLNKYFSLTQSTTFFKFKSFYYPLITMTYPLNEWNQPNCKFLWNIVATELHENIPCNSVCRRATSLKISQLK